MALQRAKLGDIAFIGATAAAVYANPLGAKTFIKVIEIHNTNTVAETVKLYNVPDSGGALGVASAGNRFLNVLIPANDTLQYSRGYPWVLTDQNDSIQAETSTGSKVTISLGGDVDV